METRVRSRREPSLDDGGLLRRRPFGLRAYMTYGSTAFPRDSIGLYGYIHVCLLGNAMELYRYPAEVLSPPPQGAVLDCWGYCSPL